MQRAAGGETPCPSVFVSPDLTSAPAFRRRPGSRSAALDEPGGAHAEGACCVCPGGLRIKRWCRRWRRRRRDWAAVSGCGRRRRRMSSSRQPKEQLLWGLVQYLDQGHRAVMCARATSLVSSTLEPLVAGWGGPWLNRFHSATPSPPCAMDRNPCAGSGEKGRSGGRRGKGQVHGVQGKERELPLSYERLPEAASGRVSCLRAVPPGGVRFRTRVRPCFWGGIPDSADRPASPSLRIGRFWFGSSADELVRTLSMPVLLVRPREGVADGRRPCSMS